MADNYTAELKEILDRTNTKGNLDTVGMQRLSSVLWRIDQRLEALEAEIVPDDKPAAPKAPKKSTKKKDD